MKRLIIELIVTLLMSGLASYAVVWRSEAVHESRLRSLEGGQKTQQDQREQDMKVLYNIQGQVQSVADDIRSLRDDIRSLRR